MFRTVLVAFALTFLLHLSVLGADFVWDDLQITADDYVHNPANWPDVLTFRTLERDIIDNNRPVMLLSLMADAALYGRHPLGYHVTNVLLHAANAALVCYLALRLLPSVLGRRRIAPPAWWAVASTLGPALLFAAHPLNVEPISVIAFREDPQTTFFVLIALTCATQIIEPTCARRRTLLVILGSISVALAIGTKESAVAAPLALLAYAWTQRRAPSAGGADLSLSGRSTTGPLAGARSHANVALWSLVGAAALIVAIFFVARYALRPATSEVFVSAPRRIADSFGGWFIAQSRINAFHLERVFHFRALSSDYTPLSLKHISGAVGIGATVVSLAALAWLATRGRLMLIGAVLIFAGMAAVANLAPLYNPIADRYLYLPLAGAALLGAGVLTIAGTTAVRRVLLGSALAVTLIIVAAHSVARQRVFHDDVSLWTDALEKTPESVVAGNLRGWELYARGDFAAALASFEIALKNSGGREPDSWAAGALCCRALGHVAEAERGYRRAVEVSPLFRNPRLIKRGLLWHDEYLAELAVIARPTGLWIEPTQSR